MALTITGTKKKLATVYGELLTKALSRGKRSSSPPSCGIHVIRSRCSRVRSTLILLWQVAIRDRAIKVATQQNEDWGLGYIDLFLIHFPVALEYNPECTRVWLVHIDMHLSCRNWLRQGMVLWRRFSSQAGAYSHSRDLGGSWGTPRLWYREEHWCIQL